MATSLNTTFEESIGLGDSFKGFKRKSPYLIGRVAHVVTGPFYDSSTTPDPNYKNPTDIGVIVYQLIQGIQDRTSQGSGNPIARPIQSSLKHMPVEGELVLLVPGPSLKSNKNRGQQTYFYLAPFNVWNSSNHNAMPNLGDVANFSNQTKRSYNQNTNLNQATNLTTNQTVTYPLSPLFNEKGDIRALRTFTGDITLEGRWGNSIRFGSTTKNRQENTWSKEGEIGNPITILRNGQGKQLNNDPWVPTVEDINRDGSSIYLTSGQKIVIDDIQNNFSLASLQYKLERTYTTSIPVQQQLTSIDSISPLQQDKNVTNQPTTQEEIEVVENTQAAQLAQTPATTPIPQTPPTSSQAQETTNVRGTFIKDYTNTANQTIELFYKRSGFTTTVYGYLKNSGKLVYTGQPSNSTSTSIETLTREAELTLKDNTY